jgi:iron(II)-dependent oxidoreductase
VSAVAGDEWLDVPAGPFAMGAHPDVFAYDNERPRHEVHVPAFRIAKRPVTNASWLTFTEGGGYVRREWWSDEGWAWTQDQDINGDHVRADEPLDAPVCHVSWFEADAFARSVGARLPTEAEWEKAATWEQSPRESNAGGSPAATWEQSPRESNDPAPFLEGLGQAWEWTSSEFTAYPGFSAHPYREYSEVFFDRGYRVLRGGSWATDPRVATPTFRNWDLPQRSQIFSGVRLAADITAPHPTPSPRS